MSTSLYLNSLVRFDEDKQTVKNPSPFDFAITEKVTGNWVFERRPFSRTALTKDTSTFQVNICKVMVPKIFMPEQKPVLQLELTHATTINRTIGPNIKNTNIYALGATGITGIPQSCIPCGVTGECTIGRCPSCRKSYYSLGITGIPTSCTPASGLNDFNQTWTLYPADNPETATYWMYDSCSQMAINSDWKKLNLYLRLRDEAGYIVIPAGFTEQDLCEFNRCLVTSFYAPLFVLENQFIVIFNVTYVENDAVGLEHCF